MSDQQRAPRTYRSSRREAQARHTRQRILNAATGLFLDRGYAGTTVRGIAAVIGPAQQRSAGLVMAVFEGARSDAELSAVAEQLIAQRAITAEWIVDALTAQTSLRPRTSRQQAIDTVWVLMDPAVFERLTRHRGWTQPDYQRWLAQALRRLLTADT